MNTLDFATGGIASGKKITEKPLAKKSVICEDTSLHHGAALDEKRFAACASLPNTGHSPISALDKRMLDSRYQRQEYPSMTHGLTPTSRDVALLVRLQRP